ncbi:MAG: calcium/sodium antiporter [Spirochaetales bacterium]|nr:calcium/sodium antiporter [Spirochaetales bacterium]
MLSIFLFFLGFLPLLLGARLLVDGASSLADRYGVPQIVIGLTIVAFGTSAPELVVNVAAALNGETALVLGNVLGSNIFNILGILGVSALIMPLVIRANTTWIEIPLVFLAGGVLWLFSQDALLEGRSYSEVSRIDGAVLLAFFIIFLVYNIRLSHSETSKEELSIHRRNNGVNILFILAGLTGLAIGGRLIVHSAVQVAETLGVSERIIGLTIVSIGTSLPELATSVVAALRKNTDIAVGNIVGSNIFNIFLILGLSALLQPVPLLSGSGIDLLVNLGSSFLLFIFVFTGPGRKLHRWEGLLFVLLYGGYMVFLLFN